jgi:ferredoxin
MSETRWKLSVDPKTCKSSGVCVSVAAERFELTEEGARPREEELGPDDSVVPDGGDPGGRCRGRLGRRTVTTNPYAEGNTT